MSWQSWRAMRFFDDPATPVTGNGDPPIMDVGAQEFQGLAGSGDFDGDSDVDLVDFAALVGCFTGPWQAGGFTGPAADCLIAFDGDVDLPDFAGFQPSFSTTQ